MGFDLRNKRGDCFNTNISGWDHQREPALAFAWKAAGTPGPEDDDHEPELWGGAYFSNDNQRVSDETPADLLQHFDERLPPSRQSRPTRLRTASRTQCLIQRLEQRTQQEVLTLVSFGPLPNSAKRRISNQIVDMEPSRKRRNAKIDVNHSARPNAMFQAFDQQSDDAP